MPLHGDERDHLADELSRLDLSCELCGYNLRGIKHARCPECGRELSLADLARPRNVHAVWRERALRSAVVAGWLLAVTYFIEVSLAISLTGGFTTVRGHAIAALAIALCSVPLALHCLPRRSGEGHVAAARRDLIGAVLGWAIAVVTVIVATMP